MAAKQRVLKLTIMQHRNPSMSEEDFHAHWTRKHAPLASAWLQRNEIISYTQVSSLHVSTSIPDLEFY